MITEEPTLTAVLLPTQQSPNMTFQHRFIPLLLFGSFFLRTFILGMNEGLSWWLIKTEQKKQHQNLMDVVKYTYMSVVLLKTFYFTSNFCLPVTWIKNEVLYRPLPLLGHSSLVLLWLQNKHTSFLYRKPKLTYCLVQLQTKWVKQSPYSVRFIYQKGFCLCPNYSGPFTSFGDIWRIPLPHSYSEASFLWIHHLAKAHVLWHGPHDQKHSLPWP